MMAPNGRLQFAGKITIQESPPRGIKQRQYEKNGSLATPSRLGKQDPPQPPIKSRLERLFLMVRSALVRSPGRTPHRPAKTGTGRRPRPRQPAGLFGPARSRNSGNISARRGLQPQTCPPRPVSSFLSHFFGAPIDTADPGPKKPGEALT